METPSSTRRITRSQNKAAFSITTNLSSKKVEESKQRKCLIDITNDSPIVGLASGNLNETPISAISKQKNTKLCNKTPGSGEALLRGQVKNLLQNVEEEAAISKFLSFHTTACVGRHGLKSFLNSPSGLLAPTPSNTPAFHGFDSLGCVLESPIEDQLSVSKVLSVIPNDKQQAVKELVSEKDIISRTLFLDFSEDKSDSSADCSSVVEQVNSPSKDEDDDASTWSIQVNASTRDEDEDEDEDEDIADDFEIDELCEGLKSISVNEETTFMGKHIRYVYNSDDELVKEEIEGEVLRLKGLPTPKGKHLRFQDDE